MKNFNSDLFKKFEDQKILKDTAKSINGGRNNCTDTGMDDVPTIPTKPTNTLTDALNTTGCTDSQF